MKAELQLARAREAELLRQLHAARAFPAPFEPAPGDSHAAVTQVSSASERIRLAMVTPCPRTRRPTSRSVPSTTTSGVGFLAALTPQGLSPAGVLPVDCIVANMPASMRVSPDVLEASNTTTPPHAGSPGAVPRELPLGGPSAPYSGYPVSQLQAVQTTSSSNDCSAYLSRPRFHRSTRAPTHSPP